MHTCAATHFRPQHSALSRSSFSLPVRGRPSQARFLSSVAPLWACAASCVQRSTSRGRRHRERERARTNGSGGARGGEAKTNKDRRER